MDSRRSERAPRPGGDAAVAAALLARMLADREGGGLRPAEEYRALFPGHEALVDRELAALEGAGEARRSFGPYRVERELGRGGQGVVWLAEDTRLGRRVALKVLEGLGPRSRDVLERFRREALVASRLDHPGICGVLESGERDGAAWIAMRLVEGETLAARIARAREAQAPPGRDEVLELARLGELAARALHAAHEAGVVHRDVKPGNVAVTPAGEPVLLDFGLARDESGATLTATGDVFGTPAYMSPEQLAGSGPRPDRRTDVYSLGATLYEAVALRPPFEAATREGLYRAILEDEPADARRANPAVPRDLSVVLATALEKRPDRRYASAADLAEDLRRARTREPILARPAGPLLRLGRWMQRNPALASMTAGLFVALVAGLAVTSSLLRASEQARSELAAANVQLEAQVDDVLAGRRSKRELRIQSLVESAFQEAMGATVGDARQKFEQVLAEVPGHVAAAVGRAWCELPDGAAALAALERFAATPDDPDVLWMRGLLLELSGQGARAEEAYARAGERPSGLRLYLQGLRAARMFETFDPERLGAALALFRRAVLLAPSPQFHFVHAWLMSASYLGEREQMDEAAALLEHHWPDVPTTWDAIAQFYATVDPGRAEAALDRHLELEPAAAPWCGKAFLAMQRGDVEGALAAFGRAVEVDADFAPAWMMRAELELSRGAWQAARAGFLQSLARDPRYAPAWDGLVRAHEGLDRPSVARGELRALVERHPDSADGLAALARLCLEAGEADEAEALLAAAARRAPQDATLLSRWRDALDRGGDPARAEAALRAFAEEHASHAAWTELARHLRAQGATDAARAAYERALELHPAADAARAELATLGG